MPITITCACGATLEYLHLSADAKCPQCGVNLVGPATAKIDTAVQAEEPLPPRHSSADPVADERARPIKKSGGGTLVIVAVCVLAVLCVAFPCVGAGIWWVGLAPALATGGEEKARAQINVLTNATQAYSLKKQRWPEALQALLVKDEFGVGPFLANPDHLVDPWGRQFMYDPAGQRNNGRQPDIWTVAPDGTEIGNWPGKVGFRK